MFTIRLAALPARGNDRGDARAESLRNVVPCVR